MLAAAVASRGLIRLCPGGCCAQGRLTENTKTVNKDDLLAMVRYGAETIFTSEVRPALTASVSMRHMHDVGRCQH